MEQWCRNPGLEIKQRAFVVIDPKEVEGWEDVSGGAGGVFKKLIRAGEGSTPLEGAWCTVHQVGSCGGAQFESTRAEGEFPLEFNVGGGQVISGIDIAVATMKAGELSRFFIDPIYAYREVGMAGKVPRNAAVEFEIELLKFEDPMTMEQRIEKAQAVKLKANQLFSEKAFEQARQEYNEAKRILGTGRVTGMPGHESKPPPAEVKEQHRALRAQVLTNIMQCWAKENNNAKVIEVANEVLKLDSNNTKALFRLAQTYLTLCEYEKCTDSLDKWGAIDSENADLKALRAKLAVALAKESKKERAMFGGILTNNKGEGAAAPSDSGS